MQPEMEMFQRDTSHLGCGCICIWRWNYEGTKLRLFQSLYKRTGCKMRLTTCKTSYCECCSTQLIFEIEGFLCSSYQIRRNWNFKIIQGNCSSVLQNTIAFKNGLVGLLIAAVAGNIVGSLHFYSLVCPERHLPIAVPVLWLGGQQMLMTQASISLALWITLPGIVIVNIWHSEHGTRINLS